MADCVTSICAPTAVTQLASVNCSKAAIDGKYEVVLSAKSCRSHITSSTIDTMLLHIIYTETAMFLSKKAYPSWRDIQDEFTDYKASVGPWETDVVTEYLQDEYPDLMPTAASQVTELIQSDAVLRKLSFLASA